MAIRTVGCERNAIYNRLCEYYNCPDVSFLSDLDAGCKYSDVSLISFC